ncbi:transposase-like protein [Mesorhizobium sp. URHB0026]|jgi:transposase-like protein
MALSKQLLDQNLTFQCPSCKTPLVRKGSWVKSVTTFTCKRCGQRVRLSYSEKLEIFRLAAGPCGTGT